MARRSDAGLTDTTDLATVPREVGKLPAISAEAYQHVGRYAGSVVLAVFQQMGGVDRMMKWADTNPTDFYTKLMPKIMSRTAQVDVSGSITIDEAISRLESNTVDAEFTEIPSKEWDL